MYKDIGEALRHFAINADSGDEIGESDYQLLMQAADVIDGICNALCIVRKLKVENEPLPGWDSNKRNYYLGVIAGLTMAEALFNNIGKNKDSK